MLMFWDCLYCDFGFRLNLHGGGWEEGGKTREQVKKMIIDEHLPYCLLFQGHEMNIDSGLTTPTSRPFDPPASRWHKKRDA